MNTRILGSILTIVAVAGGVTAVTFAFFSDAGTSSNNIFSTGNLDMKLTDNNETAVDNVTSSFGITGGAPGATFSGDLNVMNSGSVDADHLELQFDNVMTESGTPPGDVSTVPMDQVVEITALDWDHDGNGLATVDLLAGVTDKNLNGIIDLDDLENADVNGLVDFDNVAFGGTQSSDHLLHIVGSYNPTLMVNQHQGDSVNTTLTFTMNQDASQ